MTQWKCMLGFHILGEDRFKKHTEHTQYRKIVQDCSRCGGVFEENIGFGLLRVRL